VPTIQQLVRNSRRSVTWKSKAPRWEAAPETGVCTRVYTTTPKKPKLGAPQGCARQAHQRHGGDAIFRRGAQPAGALDRDDPRRAREDLPVSVPYHPARWIPPRGRPEAGRSKYGAKRRKVTSR